jgi:thermitase
MRKLLLTILLLAGAVSQAYEAVPGEYVIRFKDVAHAREYLAKDTYKNLGAYRILKMATVPTVVMQLSRSVDARTALREITRSPHIAYIEPNYIYRIPAGMDRFDQAVNREPQKPNDDRFDELWGLYNRGDNGGRAGFDINALKAWTVTQGRPEIIVAVIDTGIDYKHPDLAANMWKNEKEVPGNNKDDDGNGLVDDVYGYDFANHDADPMDDHRHGTHCAGTIGAVHNNKIGVAGVMAKVRLMPVKFLSSGGGGTLAGAVEAIGYATRMGAHILSNSWGGGPFTQALYEAIKAAGDRNQVFVAAAGNYHSDNDKTPFYPAGYDLPNVISVAAIDRAGKPASFTNFGKKTVHVAAPGVNILSTVLNGGYEMLSGTSMATPHVSGVAGLILSKEGSRALPTMRARLMAGSKKDGNLGDISASGGFVNAFASLGGKE